MKKSDCLIEKIIKYAEYHLDLLEDDIPFFRNRLINIFNIKNYYKLNISNNNIKQLSRPDKLIKEIKRYCKENNIKDSENKVNEVFGILTPLPSKINQFYDSLENGKKEKGLDYLYKLSLMNNYINLSNIEKNIKFGNKLIVQINLIRREKSNKEVSKSLNINNTYPKCNICKENIGLLKEGKTTLRTINIKLNKEDWFIQFSPYSYVNNHIIVINTKHKKMEINKKTFSNLIELVDTFPSYFFGSNSELPIVGGSILNHQHYQGGKCILPSFYSKDKKIFLIDKDIKISYLDWYNSTIKIESTNKEKLLFYCNKILKSWKKYQNKDLEIIPYTNNNTHSTITPLIYKKDKKYIMHLTLKNNRCNNLYPDGIFHSHKKYHHIKKEGIGLIESNGVFILPRKVKSILNKKHDFLAKNTILDRKFLIEEYIENICIEILKNTAVFKNDEKDIQSLDNFMKHTLK